MRMVTKGMRVFGRGHTKPMKKWIYGIYGGFLLALALFFAQVSGCARAPESPAPTPTPSQPGATSHPGLAADAVVIWRRHYQKCGHVHDDIRAIEVEMVGSSMEEYAAYHLGYSARPEPDGDGIMLMRTIFQYCPDHYIIKDDGGTLALFRNEDGGEDLTRISRLRYQAHDLPEELRALVYEGIPYSDITELEGMLNQIAARP